MIRRLLSRLVPASAPARATVVEQLEQRKMMATHVTAISTDNRGEVLLTLSADLDPKTVNRRSIQLYSTGSDGTPATADDVKQNIRLKWFPSNNRLHIRTLGLRADTTYWFKLSAKQVRDTNGDSLDGEFNGAGKRTGNNVVGGDLIVVSKRDKGTRPEARFSTTVGTIDVNLFKDLKPKTFGNFVKYANAGSWDNTFIHRSVPGFVIQGGGFLVKNNEIDDVVEHAAVQNEPGGGVLNTRGRISMAKIGGQPNSATNEWFFNVANNPDLDSQNGGFTAFGEINSASGLAVMDAINGYARVNAGGAFNEIPVRDEQAVIDRGRLDPNADLVTIRRVAIINKVAAFVKP